MKQKQSLTLLVCCIAVLAAFSAAVGAFSGDGPGRYEHTSIRGKVVPIWGKGLYQHMSWEVAPQGIAQDYITLFVAVPLLVIALLWARRGSLRGRLLLTGTLGYFLVGYLFYLVMGMYNALFLAYVFLAGASFFAFVLSIRSFDIDALAASFKSNARLRFPAGLLMFSSASVALLWLSIVVPPLLDGSIIPVQVEHYTTLIVQGLDLAILLPATFLSGLLMLRRTSMGYLLGTVILVFLSLQMTALVAKIVAMAMLGQNVIPVVFIIPLFNIAAICCAVITFKGIRENTRSTAAL
jgi:hypothetical protein